jgi:drug/metabolite transporter (DMT)-like permease
MPRVPMLAAALALVFNAFTWGVSWWPFRRLEALGLHPLWSTVLVYALAAAAIGVARPHAWRRLAQTPSLWVLVVASGTTNAAFNWAVTVGDVVRVVLLFYLMPLWAVLLAKVLLDEPLTRAALLRVVLAFAGAMTVLWPEGAAAWPLPRDLADVLGLVGGVAFALNNVMLRRLRDESEPARALAMFCGGVLVATTAALLAPDVAAPPAVQPGWLAGVCALGIVFLLSNLALQYGAARLPANVTAVIMLSEVLFAAVSAVAFGGGVLTPRLAAGGALIVLAAVLAVRQPMVARPLPG